MSEHPSTRTSVCPSCGLADGQHKFSCYPRDRRPMWEPRGGAMQEDGLHGVDGYDVWKGDERADDSFSQDREDAQEMADRLNEEDDHA